MITVHHLEHSRSQRVLWLMEELRLDYTIQHYKRDKTTRLAPPELLAVHPLGKSPVITDERNGETITVAETGAIVEYVLKHYGSQLLPPDDTQEQRDYTYWLHAAEGSVAPFLVMALIFNKVENAPVPFFLKPVVKGIAKKVQGSFIDPNLERQTAFINDTLAKTGWFAGDTLSGADIMMSFACEGLAVRADLDKAPEIRKFLDKVHARPAYKAAIKKGGPYELMN